MDINNHSVLHRIINETEPVKKVEKIADVTAKEKKIIDPEGNEYTPGTLSNYSQEQLQKMIDQSNKHLLGKDAKLTYKVHESTKKTIITLVDTNTEEVIREIPSEKMLDSIANIWEMVGIIVNKEG
ncbi:flagellar protein FlaG [Vagococcus carniphilus]|uniref:flagellar protein FlaG n=1 Tax=Vagococcus carniphilus TaxID=218144 RepID=UPI0028918645|nr:flagellar protein FlaG [Vagococcus carniphilus]MDT2815840.1 flagellar protein FlaG [Vagococcus carniphilus]MDT2829649.1 flagellar protein FlaG [Vagococcus carniphilus]MDT2839108.1 flagellar protein FlaG [Vagococcus carniphilus]MDT2853166.1 flagellar protein FlaG [Vagococcus carniphilus]